MSHAINELVVKVAARCNIDCDYCYEFNLGDATWRGLPKRMSPATMEALADRIREHAVSHRLNRFHIGLHGGEPTLLGAEGLSRVATTLRRAASGSFAVDISMQTNATLISPAIARVIVEHNIAVGVSLDGDRASNDRHRVDHQGRSTFEAALRGINVLRMNAPRQFSGLLSVIDLRNDPVAVLDFVGGIGVAHVDFLLPHHTWDRPPIRIGQGADYSEWYFAVYQAWVSGRQSHLRIRFLEHLIRQIVGGAGLYEQNTLEPATLAVVNTAGGFEALDAIKSAEAGAQSLNLNVFSHSLDDVLLHPMVACRQTGREGLCSTCRSCPRVEQCGGGYFPHRYRSDTGFDNPSVYCGDLKDLLGRIEADLLRRTRTRT